MILVYLLWGVTWVLELKTQKNKNSSGDSNKQRLIIISLTYFLKHYQIFNITKPVAMISYLKPTAFKNHAETY